LRIFQKSQEANNFLSREIGYLRATAGEILTHPHEAMDPEQDPSPFAAVVARAPGETWTRDPFDRIIPPPDGDWTRRMSIPQKGVQNQEIPVAGHDAIGLPATAISGK
jgi:hypothetical protein